MADADELIASNTYIEAEITRRLRQVEDCTDMDVAVCIHPILAPFDDLIRNQIEDIRDKKSRSL